MTEEAFGLTSWSQGSRTTEPLCLEYQSSAHCSVAALVLIPPTPCSACPVPKFSSLTEQLHFRPPRGHHQRTATGAPCSWKGDGSQCPGQGSHHPLGHPCSWGSVGKTLGSTPQPPWPWRLPCAPSTHPGPASLGRWSAASVSWPKPQLVQPSNPRSNWCQGGLLQHTLLLSLISHEGPRCKAKLLPGELASRSLPLLALAPCFAPLILKPSRGAGCQTLTVLCPFLLGASLHPSF